MRKDTEWQAGLLMAYFLQPLSFHGLGRQAQGGNIRSEANVLSG